MATLGCDFRPVLQGSVWLQELGADGQVYGLVGIASLTFRIQGYNKTLAFYDSNRFFMPLKVSDYTITDNWKS